MHQPVLSSLIDVSKLYTTITKISFIFIHRSDIETHQYQMTFEIPKISVKAQYRSSGVLILVRASGAGDYWGEYRKIMIMPRSVCSWTKTILSLFS